MDSLNLMTLVEQIPALVVLAWTVQRFLVAQQAQNEKTVQALDTLNKSLTALSDAVAALHTLVVHTDKSVTRIEAHYEQGEEPPQG